MDITYATTLYLDLMKLTLTDLIYENNLRSRKRRVKGRDWPKRAYTMIGIKRLNNIQKAVEHVLKFDVPGDLIEAGVWRGGATIFMRALLKAYGNTDRTVWVADSFEGLPEPNVEKYPADEGMLLHTKDKLAVSRSEVQRNFERFNLYDKQVKFLEGWFKDTLPTCPVEQLSILRIDGDYYESVTDSLVHLYDKVAPGGWIIIDDYKTIPCCRQAVIDFRKARGITDPIIKIDWVGVYWIKRKLNEALR